MQRLTPFDNRARLFTYKVAYDAGSAPNPYHGLCTLAICKPAIRRVAKPGDVVVGLDCGASSDRIVYCMVVEHVVSWRDYIEICYGRSDPPGSISRDSLARRIPGSESDPGDCIWEMRDNTNHLQDALPSWSDHGGSDYDHDVEAGKNVLLGREYWYFGRGDRLDLRLPDDDLRAIIPGRGHRSDANWKFRERFVEFFNDALHRGRIASFGRQGLPSHDSGTADPAQRARCRAQERELDGFDEDS